MYEVKRSLRTEGARKEGDIAKCDAFEQVVLTIDVADIELLGRTAIYRIIKSAKRGFGEWVK